MTEKVTVLPSGILVVEYVTPTPPPRVKSGIVCRVCGVRDDREFFEKPAFYYPAGWVSHDPCCRHGKWWECPSCQEGEPPMGPGHTMTPERTAYFANRNCPVCGTDEEYT